MEIDKDTALSDILDSSEVINITQDLKNTVWNKLYNRSGVINKVMGSGFDESVLVDDEPVFFNASSDLYSKIDTLSSDVSSTFNGVVELSENKEIEELNKLKDAINKYIDELDTSINDLQIAYATAASEAEDTTSLYNEYYNEETGYIPLKKAERKKYFDKLQDVQTRISKVQGWNSYADAARDGFANILTEREFSRMKASNSDKYDKYDSYEDYLAAMREKYMGSGDNTEADNPSAGSPSTTSNSFSNIPDDQWSPEVSFTNLGSQVNYEETTQSDGTHVSRATSSDGKVLYYSTNKDGNVYWYDSNGKLITSGTAIAMQSVENRGHVESDNWERPQTFSVQGDVTDFYTLDTGYKDVKVDLTTDYEGNALFFEVSNENGDRVCYDSNYNEISPEQVEAIKAQYRDGEIEVIE